MNKAEIRTILRQEFKAIAGAPSEFNVYFRPPLQAEKVGFMVRAVDWSDKVFYADSMPLHLFEGMCRVNKRLHLRNLAQGLARQYNDFAETRMKSKLKDHANERKIASKHAQPVQAVLIPIENEEVPF